MEYGISHLSIVSVRAEPGDRFEQISQLLFGEHFTILEKQLKWVHIKSAHDGYTGWIDAKQYRPVSGAEFMELDSADAFFAWGTHTRLTSHSPDILNGHLPVKTARQVVTGSVLPFFDGSSCLTGDISFTVLGETSRYTGFTENLLEHLISVYLHAPYQWGGRSPYGIDCSGLMQIICRFAGIKIARDAAEQSLLGTPVRFIDLSIAGDFAFFENEVGRIIHVGLMIGNRQIFHASGEVRIDLVDSEGIFNEETGKYTHKLCQIKRLFQV